jgi:hypothetical protein
VPEFAATSAIGAMALNAGVALVAELFGFVVTSTIS